LFGRVAYRLPLGAAVSAGLVAPFRIFVAEITDPDVQAEAVASERPLNRISTRPEEVEAFRGARLAALQTGMLKIAWEHDLRRVLTFHHRVTEAQAYALHRPHRRQVRRVRRAAASRR